LPTYRICRILEREGRFARGFLTRVAEPGMIHGMSMKSTPSARLRLCDACCDKAGILKEMVKTGGCTCDICGFSCKCCGMDPEARGKQYVNSILVRVIPDMAWAVLQERNRRSLVPLDWERLFAEGRARNRSDRE